MDIFEMWLEGVKIILPFMIIGVSMLVVTALLLFTFDLFLMVMLKDLFGIEESLICIAIFKCKNYNELKEKIKNQLNRKRKEN